MGFQCTKWILNCDACTRPFIAEELFSWILSITKNSVMINGSKGYVEPPNTKTEIGSVSFQIVVLFLFEAFYWLNISKNYGNHERFLAILLLYFQSNICSRTQLKPLGKNNPVCWYNSSNVHLVLLSQYECHLLSLYIEEIHVFQIIYLWVLLLAFSS